MQLLILFLLITGVTFAQTKGVVTIIKDPLIDTLIAKRVALNKTKPITTNLASNAIVSQMGYRVQVFYGSDRRLTFSEQARFKASYPKLGTYIIYKEPNYYLRVGNFRTRMEAQKLLTELKTSFATLFIFKEKINAPDLEKTNP